MRALKINHLSSDILVNFYHCTIKSILTNCITVWFRNFSVSDRRAFQKVVKTAHRIAGASLPAIDDIYRNVTKDPYHTEHIPFAMLPCGRRYRSLQTRTT